MSEQCWFHSFSPNETRCPNPAEWHWPTAENGFVRSMRWCWEHKHPNDERITKEATNAEK